MEQSNSDNETECYDNETECYLYVQIIGSRTGKAAIRQIVPSSCVKKFNYDAYTKDNQLYKNNRLSIKLHPDAKKQKCYVLYAASDQHEVQEACKAKRFAPPPAALSETLTDESRSAKSVERESTEQNTAEDIENEEALDNSEDAAQEAEKNKKEMVKKGKVTRKRKATTVKKNKTHIEERIVQRYLDNLDNYEDEFNMNIPAMSSPLQNVSENNQSDKIIHAQKIRIKHLEHQLKQYRREIADRRNGCEDSENENRNTATAPKTACCTTTDYFKLHDKMFDFVKEQVQPELEYDEKGNVHLGSQVYCNARAYNDTFKSKKAINCLSLLSEGVYGLKELSERCVRKQSNTQDKKVLSPTKRLVIEKKVYALMRIKDQSLAQIDDFLVNMNAHHRQVINGAKARLDYLKQQKEKEKGIDEELQNL